MIIAENQIENLWQGIYLRYSENNEIFENKLNEANILLYYSHYNQIYNNSIVQESLGIILSASNNNDILDNYLSDIGYRGIDIMGDSNLIEGNKIETIR